jgi:hypothetical protein
MIKRTFKLISGILIGVFAPFVLGFPVKLIFNYLLDYNKIWPIPLQWVAGLLIPAAGIIVYILTSMIYNYIKHGDIVEP